MITYAVYSNINYIVDTQTEAGLFEAITGSILVPVIGADSYETYEETKYTISFTVNNPITAGGFVFITFPDQIDILDPTYSEGS